MNKIVSGIVGGLLTGGVIIGAGLTVYKTVGVSQEAYDKVVVYAGTHNLSYRDAASFMIVGFNPILATSTPAVIAPVLHTTFYTNTVAMTKGLNTFQAYLEGWLLSDYTMVAEINGVKNPMTNFSPVLYYNTLVVKTVRIDSSALGGTFIIKFIAFDLSGKEIATRNLTVINQ